MPLLVLNFASTFIFSLISFPFLIFDFSFSMWDHNQHTMEWNRMKSTQSNNFGTINARRLFFSNLVSKKSETCNAVFVLFNCCSSGASFWFSAVLLLIPFESHHRFLIALKRRQLECVADTEEDRRWAKMKGDMRFDKMNEFSVDVKHVRSTLLISTFWLQQ